MTQSPPFQVTEIATVANASHESRLTIFLRVSRAERDRLRAAGYSDADTRLRLAATEKVDGANHAAVFQLQSGLTALAKEKDASAALLAEFHARRQRLLSAAPATLVEQLASLDAERKSLARDVEEAGRRIRAGDKALAEARKDARAVIERTAGEILRAAQRQLRDEIAAAMQQVLTSGAAGLEAWLTATYAMERLTPEQAVAATQLAVDELYDDEEPAPAAEETESSDDLAAPSVAQTESASLAEVAG